MTPQGRRSRLAAHHFATLLSDARHSDLRWLRTALRRLEKDLLACGHGMRERTEIRRRVAEHIVGAHLSCAAPWPTTRRALHRLDALGYSNVDRRVHFAIVLGRYALKRPAASRTAADRLRLELRRIKALPRRSPFRHAYEPMMNDLLDSLSSQARSAQHVHREA